MILAPELRRQFSRMEEARRQTQRQLDKVDRQITRRVPYLIPGLPQRRRHNHRSKALDPGAFIERYRSQLAAMTTERQSEIDAPSSKLALQEQEIANFTKRHRHQDGVSEQVPTCQIGSKAADGVDGSG